MPSNTAAWLTAPKAKPLELKSAPYTSPGEHEIVVRNAAVAVNPIDWKLQDLAIFPMNYPIILGRDLAGVVVEVGSSVSRFHKGDRVLAHAVGLASKRDCDAAFQQYTVVLARMASPIPDTLSFEHAAVIPLGLSTAAAGLFQRSYLNLQLPSAAPPTPTGKTLLIWGGASSVGSNAIQLAVAAGYEVIATCSAKNFARVTRLGASQVFDYNNPTVVYQIVDAFNKGRTLAGALDTININGAFQSCVDVLVNKSPQGGDRKFVATVGPAPMPEELPAGVGAKWTSATDIKDNNVSKAIYEDFLPRALAERRFVAAPEPYVVGKGLGSVQAGLEAQKKGMSAKKVVITL